VLILGISGQSYASLHLSSESANSLSGYMQDPAGGSRVLFWAAYENSRLTIRVQFIDYTLELIKGDKELYVTADSEDRLSRSISTSEKGSLDKLANHMHSQFMDDSPFHTGLECLLRFLASWPPGMPINVAMNSSTITVGKETISREIVDLAREQALLGNMDLYQQEAASLDTPVLESEAWTSLCSKIGKISTACYPTSLIPPRVKCDQVLVGGTTCRGRCGTGCTGLCSKNRYTVECFNHDRCAGVYWLAHRYCNFIFLVCSDDCVSATDCKDVPGVWRGTFDWGCNGGAGNALWYINPAGTFKDNYGTGGTWTMSGSTVLLKYSSGCKPTYTGTISSGRLNLSGSMRCTVGSASGCWSAYKTNISQGSMTAPIDASGQFRPDMP
jgi:hypothetical protein